ncbi:hypothetical protein BpHYR1_013827 [Brachionus plicatilis]|uniref:Uncharacterized protein n=1 Tax=Brachionus plicatilis TaxID=10195 RepID=A0A3M7SWI4_BRAPC|nr:hypothetical protein BpHYR1_013827 [Brachionus plicatilis]
MIIIFFAKKNILARKNLKKYFEFFRIQFNFKINKKRRKNQNSQNISMTIRNNLFRISRRH